MQSSTNKLWVLIAAGYTTPQVPSAPVWKVQERLNEKERAGREA